MINPKLRQHAPLILTGVSVFGIVGTAVLGVRAGTKAERILRELDLPEDPKDRIIFCARNTWQCYIAVTLAAVLSATAAIASHKLSAADIARLATLATGSGAALNKYRYKIKEILGEEKEQEIFEEVKSQTGYGILYPRINPVDPHYDDLYMRYRLDFGIPEIPPIEFQSNPQRVIGGFYAFNRDFNLGRIVDAALLKDYLCLPYNDVDHRYFWIDTMFYDAGYEGLWIDYHIDDPDENGVCLISVADGPIDNKTLEAIESGVYWDELRR